MHVARRFCRVDTRKMVANYDRLSRYASYLHVLALFFSVIRTRLKFQIFKQKGRVI